MATFTITKGVTFSQSGAYQASDLNNLVDSAQVSLTAGSIENADISSSAGIAISKLATINAYTIAGNFGTAASAPTAIAFTANTFPAANSSGTAAMRTITDFGLSMLAGTSAAAVNTTLELGNSATRNVGTASNTVCAGDDSRLVRPYFQASMSGNQTIGNSTHTKGEFDTEVVDSNGWYDNVTNYRYTPQKAGYYRVNVAARLGGTAPTAFVWSIYKNSSSVGSINIDGSLPVNDGRCVTKLVYCNGTSDFIEAYFYITDATSRTVQSGDWTYFEAEWVAA